MGTPDAVFTVFLKERSGQLLVIVVVHGIQQSGLTLAVNAHKYVNVLMQVVPNQVIPVPHHAVFKILNVIHIFPFYVPIDVICNFYCILSKSGCKITFFL